MANLVQRFTLASEGLVTFYAILGIVHLKQEFECTSRNVVSFPEPECAPMKKGYGDKMTFCLVL